MDRDVPNPTVPTNGFHCEYDARRRLVGVNTLGGRKIAEYDYDGLHRRTIKRTYAGAASNNLIQRRHFYYSAS